MQLIHESTDLALELRRKIKDFKLQNPGLTSFDIAKQFGLAPATFHRLENVEIKKPSFEQVSKVLKGIGCDTELYGFIEKHYPEILEVVESKVDKNLETKKDISSKAMEVMLDEKYGQVFRYIMSKKASVTEKEIIYEFGQHGQRALLNLKERSLIILDESGRIICNEGIHIANYDNIARLASREISESFNREGANSGNSLNFLAYLTNSIDPDYVLPKIEQELRLVGWKIKKMLAEDEKCKGDTPFWLVLGTDTFTPNNLRVKGREE